MKKENKAKNFINEMLKIIKDFSLKVKNLLQKIFDKIKKEGNDAVERKVRDATIDFARKLQSWGFENEVNNIMSIYTMFSYSIKNEELLPILLTSFKEQFDKFMDILKLRINNPDEYEIKYLIYLRETVDWEEEFYLNYCEPSPHYNEEVLGEITRCLAGGLD